MTAPDGQLSLFPQDDAPRRTSGTTAPVAIDAELALVAAGVRAAFPNLRLGTSSWTFPGWRGLVYERTPRGGPSEAALRRDGLRAYAAHPLLRTVGVDRSFYAPLPAETWRAYADQTPSDFRFIVKTDRALTMPTERDGSANPRFLDVAHALRSVLAPTVVGLGTRLGVILVQFPPLQLATASASRRPLSGSSAMQTEAFLERLGAFLRGLHAWRRDQSHAFSLAIELRNREPYGPRQAARLAELLAESDVALVLCEHPAAPPLEEQVERFPPDAQPETIVRWMLRRNHRYEEAAEAYRPFDRLVEPDEAARRAVAAIIRATQSLGRAAWVVANNKAEGSSPLTIAALARALLAP